MYEVSYSKAAERVFEENQKQTIACGIQNSD